MDQLKKEKEISRNVEMWPERGMIKGEIQWQCQEVFKERERNRY